MKITKVVKDKSRDGGVYIYIESKEEQHTGDIFSIEYKEKIRYFKAEKVTAYDKETLFIKAKEYGYYNQIFKQQVDIRELIDKEVWHITDKEVIRKLQEEATYC